MKICTLASGSSGNSLYVETDHARILIDAGISNKKIKERLKKILLEAPNNKKGKKALNKYKITQFNPIDEKIKKELDEIRRLMSFVKEHEI